MPVDPTIAVTIVSSIALVVFILIMVFLALAPVVSETWAKRLDPTPEFEQSADAGSGD